MIKKLLVAACIGSVYYVLLPVLRLLGPRCAILLAAVLAWFHWLVSLLGVDPGGEGRALPALGALLPILRPGAKPRSILRRYLGLKHRKFVEFALAGTARGRRYCERAYRLEGREHLDAEVRKGRGAILLTFHFGMGEVSFPVLKLAGYDVLLHFARAMPYLSGTFAWARQAAVRAGTALDSASGPMLYHYPNYAFPRLARRLRRQGLVGINGDGMGGVDFEEVPFLGGTLRLPTGPAQLAARTGAPLLFLCALPEGLGRHRLVIHPPIRCPGCSPEAVRATMAAYAALLEAHVREHPWAWQVWKQLLVAHHEDGRLRLSIRAALPARAAAVYEPFRPAGQPTAVPGGMASPVPWSATDPV
jgi:KDO2-lipid IV(A) lauroyltransferase